MRRDLDAPRVIPEWMRFESEAPSMAGRGVSETVSNHLPDDSLENSRNRDGSGAAVTKQTYSDDGIPVSVTSNRGENRVYSGTATPPHHPYHPKLEFGDRSVEIRRVTDVIVSKTMKQNERSARNRLNNLAEKRDGKSMLQAASYYLANQAVSDIQSEDNRDSDNGASSIPGGSPRSASDLLSETSIHEHGTEGVLIKTPVDRTNQSHSRESSNVDRPTGPASSRQDRIRVNVNGTKQPALKADNVFAETLVNRANVRAGDYSVQRSSRGNERTRLNRASGRDIDDAAWRHDDSAGARGDGEAADSGPAEQTHLDGRNIYSLEDRSGDTRDSASTADYLDESDNFGATESANSMNDPNVGATMVDVIVLDYLDGGGPLIESQVAVDENSGMENRTEINLQQIDGPLNFSETKIRIMDCENNVCSRSRDNDILTVRTKKLVGAAKRSDDNREHVGVDYFTEVNDVLTVYVNDNDTDIGSGATFTGFEGSQKFPVKINHKPPIAPQVEKFDRRHFGPHKEDVLGRISTRYPNTMAPDLPKSLSTDVLYRQRKTNDGLDEISEVVNLEDGSSEETTERDEKRNDTSDESWLVDTSSVRRLPNASGAQFSPDEKLATTSSTVDDNFDSTTRGENFDFGGKMEIGVTVSSVKSIEKINITILGLFEMTHGAVPRPEGSSELQAAKLAVDRVNESDVLKHFRLRLIYNDTKVSLSN